MRVPDAGVGEVRDGINGWTAILDQFHSARSILAENQPRTILTAGGDCACDIAVIDYLHGKYPDLTVVWIDAHLDANTSATSPSGSFHGMPVAALMGSAPADLQPLLSTPLPATQFHYVSAHVGDEGEWAFQRDNGLSWLPPGQSLSGPVHVHFDLDVLDPAEFPHLAYLDGTLSLQDGLALVSSIAGSASLVGLTITEFAPADEAGAQEGCRFIERLCTAASPPLSPVV
jgi:arginase